MKTYLWNIVAFINDEEGASAIEYALLVALIALAITVGATALGTQISTMFTSAAGKLVTP
jgi:pilus assembly protein Flp/PilA